MTTVLKEALEGKEIEIKTLKPIDFKWLCWELYCKNVYYTITSDGFLKVIK